MYHKFFDFASSFFVCLSKFCQTVPFFASARLNRCFSPPGKFIFLPHFAKINFIANLVNFYIFLQRISTGTIDVPCFSPYNTVKSSLPFPAQKPSASSKKGGREHTVSRPPFSAGLPPQDRGMPGGAASKDHSEKGKPPLQPRRSAWSSMDFCIQDIRKNGEFFQP